MQALYARSILPCRAKVSVVGAVGRDQANTLVQQLLARLPQTACAPLPSVGEVQPLARASDQRIPFEAAQAQVYIGQPGFKRNDPDFFALIVGNYILGGGGFVSRLTTEVRERRGLTYGVSRDFSPCRPGPTRPMKPCRWCARWWLPSWLPAPPRWSWRPPSPT